ncbi:MAG: SUMF1/EgtB/PvdO family nonheme iron enzyme [Acidobacteriota bacterium]|nr:SUMF1/EgtB/PvdO family nonheme iron enzyme [Acidobacteriota bacterium]
MPQASGQFSGIFICYRRDDSGGYARALYDRLGSHFGDEQIFMDLVDQIEPGEDFVQVIQEAVSSCEILIALIGRSWLTIQNEAGRRLDNPNDFVRLEIAAALARDVRVIPALVEGAQMPRPQDLPEDISPLARRQAYYLRDISWRRDVDELIGILDKTLDRRREARHIAAQVAERQRREEEARQQAEERERLKRAAEAERQKQEAAEAERGGREAEERRREAERARVMIEDMSPAASSEVKPAGAALRSRPVAQTKRFRLAVMMAIIALALIVVGGVLIKLLGSRSDNKTPPLVPTPSATEQMSVEKGTVDNPPQQNVDSPQAPPGMVYVPDGTFTMGTDASLDKDKYDSPAHAVAVKHFFIDRYEVTNEEYAKFVEEQNEPPPTTWKSKNYPPGAAHEPVTGVKFDAARAYCENAGKNLPTEEEWEYAARGTDGRLYPWKGDWQAGLANADHASSGVADVGTYKGESPFGAFDMIGNAWEWTESELRPYPPKNRLPVKVPKDVRVIRGGSFDSDRNQATTTYRGGWRASAERDYSEIGFRCVKRY